MDDPLPVRARATSGLGLLLLQLACGSSPPPVPTWTPAGSMSAPRLSPGAVLLRPYGRVLVLGGETACLRLGACPLSVDEQDTVLADLYDEKKGTWTPTAPLNKPRSRAVAVYLDVEKDGCKACGMVLVAGGFSGIFGVLDGAELYDPGKPEWSVQGKMAHKRMWATAVLLRTGKVLVVGGMDESFATVATAELFDPADATWSETGPMSQPRWRATATVLPSGRVLVAGGSTVGWSPAVNGVEIASAEIYDPADGSWTPTGQMIHPRLDHQAALLQSGRVLVACGSGASAEIYDPAAGSWAAAKSMAAVHDECTATTLPSGLVLVAGGAAAAPGAELYDPVGDAWRETGTMSALRLRPLAVLLPSGRALVAGGAAVGASPYFSLSSAEVFGPE